MEIKKGTTSKRLSIFIQDSSSTTGAGLTGLLFSSAGLAWYYWREDEANVGATVVTLATMTRGTWATGGFIEKDAANMPGFYEIGIPNAALATGADWLAMELRGATNMAPLAMRIDLVGNVVKDAVDLLPAALVGGRIDASVGAMATDVVTAAAIAADAITSSELATTAVNEIRDAVYQGTLTEGYAADGAAATVEQLLYMIWAAVADFSITSTTLTCRKLDGATSAMTFTLNNETTPTSRTRAT